MKKYLYYIYWHFRTWPLRWNFPKYRILCFEETVAQIIEEKKSISRFGDGEFRLLTKERGIYFQDLNNEIAERLHEVLNSDLPNNLVCIPSSFNTKKNLNRDVKVHWLNFINEKGKGIKKAIDNRNRVFGDALISRFYLSYINKAEVHQKVKLLRRIWHNKEILIVEGEFSRLGIGNDFFNNAASIKRIICPSTNAFTKYGEILNASKKYGENKLVIIALGPAATILAHDLAKENYWALDLGHIDIEYSWFLQNAHRKVVVKGKKSAEVSSGESFYLDDEQLKILEETTIIKIST